MLSAVTALSFSALTYAEEVSYKPLLAATTESGSSADGAGNAVEQPPATEAKGAISAQIPPTSTSPYMSDWLYQRVAALATINTHYGPEATTGILGKYEAYGNKGFLEFFGYMDIPKIFGVSSSNASGIWDNGSRAFVELQPRLSLSKMTGSNYSWGPFRDILASWDITYDAGSQGKTSRSLKIYSGVGTTLVTGPVSTKLDIFARYVGDNYGAANANSWDGYKFEARPFYMIHKFENNVNLAYSGIWEFDFGSKLKDKAGSFRTNDAQVLYNGLSLTTTRYTFSLGTRYFRHGSQFDSGNGWAQYISAGVRF